MHGLTSYLYFLTWRSNSPDRISSTFPSAPTTGTGESSWTAPARSQSPQVRLTRCPIPRDTFFTYAKGRILPLYSITYITRGSGVFETKEFGIKSINQGDVMFLFPGTWHRYQPNPAVGWDEYWICFDGESVRELQRKGFISPNQPLFHADKDKDLLSLFERMMETIRESRLGFAHIAAADTLAIIARVLAQARRQNPPDRHSEPVIRNAKDLIVARSNATLDVPALAQQLGVGYSWFRQAFKRHTGLAPVQYHAQVRLHKARELLERTDLTVQEISYQLGFETQNYFSRLFKRHTGLAPKCWRQTHHSRLPSS